MATPPLGVWMVNKGSDGLAALAEKVTVVVLVVPKPATPLLKVKGVSKKALTVLALAGATKLVNATWVGAGVGASDEPQAANAAARHAPNRHLSKLLERGR